MEFLEHLAEQKRCDNDDEDDLAYHWVKSIVWVVVQLWRQAEALTDAGVPAPPESPFGGDSADRVARRVSAASSDAGFQPLPDEVALPIMEAAHRMMGIPAENLLQMLEIYKAAFDKSASRGCQVQTSRNAAKVAVANYPFSTIPGEKESWAEGVIRRNGPWVRYNEFLPQLLGDLRDACVIVLQSHTGMRINEVCGLSGGTDQETGLPSCVKVRRSKTGLNELFYVKGILAKTVDAPVDTEWLLGSRPVGSKHVPAPVRAISILDRLMDGSKRHAQDEAAKRALIVASQSGIDLAGESVVRPVKGKTLRKAQKEFVSRYVDLTHLPDVNQWQEDLATYRDSRGTSLKTHQWRTTFASYVAGVDRRMTPAIAQHFKHLSLAMTEEGYIKSHPELRKEFDSARAQKTAKFFYLASKADAPATGEFSNVVDDHRREVREIIGDQPVRQAVDALATWCVDIDLRLWFSPQGKCFIGHSPADALCHRVAGTANWKNQEPNHATAQPNICSKCRCFAIDGEHVDFWKRRFVENRTAWEQAVAGGCEREFRVAKARADQAAAILQRLQEPIPTLETDHGKTI